MERCAWPKTDLEIEYHDSEWGVPTHDDRLLFEYLTLGGAQAGLSWVTILRRRPAYREAYEGFQPERVAQYGETEILKLLSNPGIIRNRAKILSSVVNARAVLEVCEESGSFDSYIWQFVGGAPIKNTWRTNQVVPASSPESDEMARDMKKRGFQFAGTTICYAFMQTAGMVNDHLAACFRHSQV